MITSYLPSVPQALGALVLSIFVLIFCEIAPKSLALRFNERVALAPRGARAASSRDCCGRSSAASAPSPGSSCARRPRVTAVRGPFVTEEELKLLLYVGEQEGIVEQEEREMIHGILEMTDKSCAR